MKRNLIAFDDTELSDWLMDLIANESAGFLSALAEVVVTADAEDYGLIRPGLMALKHQHSDSSPERYCESSYPWLPEVRQPPKRVVRGSQSNEPHILQDHTKFVRVCQHDRALLR